MISTRTLLTTTLLPQPSHVTRPPHRTASGPADFDALVVAGARWVLLMCAVWGVLIAAAAAIELLSGGRTRALSWVGAPTWVRRLVLSLLGASLVGVPATVGLAPAGAATVGSSGGSTTSAAASSVGPDGLPPLSRPAVAAQPVTTPAPAAGPSAESTPGVAATTHVVVRPGDCLWDIASRRLPSRATGTEVAAEVARLHALNRHVIGPDPDLLRPGQRLVLPRRTHTTVHHEETP